MRHPELQQSLSSSYCVPPPPPLSDAGDAPLAADAESPPSAADIESPPTPSNTLHVTSEIDNLQEKDFDVTEHSLRVAELLDQHFALVHNNTIINDKDKIEHERRNCEAKVAFDKRQTKITYVGVMKAGKSTCISASCGHQLLPARTFPMTTVSTTISHNPNRKVPFMTIPDKPYMVILQAMAAFNRLLKEESEEKPPEHIAKFTQELEKIHFMLPQEVSGTEDIYASLTIINDLLRMCCDLYIKRRLSENLVEDLLESFESISSFPHIEVQFLTSTPITDSRSNGTLTLVDTPGPDEIRLSDVLQRVNRTILGDSDAICLVLNSRTPGNEAEAALFKMVHKCASNKVYVIVNQVDDSNHETKQSAVKQCLQNIAAFNSTLPVGTAPLVISEDHIFPLSARDAIVTMMLNKYKADNPDTENLPPAKDTIWRNFYQVIWGARWERTLQKSDLSTLAEDSDFLYKKCGMEEFLNRVVHDALLTASQKSTEATLIKIRNSALLLKKRAMNQVALLETSEDIRSSTEIIDRLQRTKEKMSELHLQGQAMQCSALQRCMNAWHLHSKKVRQALEHHITGNPDGWRYIPYFSLSAPKKKYFGDAKITGRTQEEAFLKIQPILEELRGYITAILREMLTEFVDQEYAPSLITLAQQFNQRVVLTMVQTMQGEFKKYNIHHALPKMFKVPLDDVKMQLAELPLPTSRNIENKVTKTAWYWFFGLVPWEETQVKTVYELDPTDLRNKVIAKVNSECSELDTKVRDHIEKTTNTLFDPFFSSVTEALEDISSDLLRVQTKLLQSQHEVQIYKKNAQLFCDDLTSLEKDLADMHSKVGGDLTKSFIHLSN